jgi:hypothetical protein
MCVIQELLHFSSCSSSGRGSKVASLRVLHYIREIFGDESKKSYKKLNGLLNNVGANLAKVL